MRVKGMSIGENIGERKERGDEPKKFLKERRPNLGPGQIRGTGGKTVSKFGKKVEVNRVWWTEKKAPKYQTQDALSTK